MSVIQYYPAAAPLIGDLYAKSMDWPGADEMAERLEFMLPPEIKEKKIREAAEKTGKGSPPSPTPSPPPPPPDPLLEVKLQEAALKLEELQIKLEQEKVKLEGLQLDNLIKDTTGKEKMRQVIEGIVKEMFQTPERTVGELITREGE